MVRTQQWARLSTGAAAAAKRAEAEGKSVSVVFNPKLDVIVEGEDEERQLLELHAAHKTRFDVAYDAGRAVKSGAVTLGYFLIPWTMAYTLVINLFQLINSIWGQRALPRPPHVSYVTILRTGVPLLIPVLEWPSQYGDECASDAVAPAPHHLQSALPPRR